MTIHAGPPIVASKAEKVAYSQRGEQRQRACSLLLARIERAMKDVIVPASSFDELQLVHVVRRLWCVCMHKGTGTGLARECEHASMCGVRLQRAHRPQPSSMPLHPPMVAGAGLASRVTSTPL